MCAIIRNEAPYLAEWITHHLATGFEHFYIYDNLSTDSPETVLEPFRDVVTLIPWPIPVPSQLPAYRHCLQQVKQARSCEWLMFLDPDEFVIPGPACPDFVLTQWLRERSPTSCVLAASWLMFGTSGHKTMQASTLASYTMRSSTPPRLGKSIVRPQHLNITTDSPHVFKPGPGCRTAHVSRPDRLCDHRTSNCFPPIFNPFRIHHYWTRSEAEWLAKCERGRVDLTVAKKQRTAAQMFVGDVYDDSAVRFAPPSCIGNNTTHSASSSDSISGL